MNDVLLRASSFILALAAGIAVRGFRLIDERGAAALKQILFYVTLPAVIVSNFSKVPSLSSSLLTLCLMGIGTNLFMLCAGMLMTRRRPDADKALALFCLPAYNIGAFCLPFVQSFLPPLGSVAVCMFDIGNSIMCTGGSYAIAGAYLKGERAGAAGFARRLLNSPCILVYLCMLCLSFAGLRLPDAVLTLVAPMADANAFIAMFYLGLMFHLELKREYLGAIFALVAARHLFAAACAVTVYFLLPYEPVVRSALVFVLLSPMSAIAPAYVQMCGGDAGKASAANSVTILCSLAELTALMPVLA